MSGRTFLPILLLLLSAAAWPAAEAVPDWDYPFLTADTSDYYIKDFDESHAVVTLYEDVPIGNQIATLHIIAQPEDIVRVTQTNTDDVTLSFDGTNTEQNVYIQSVLDCEVTDAFIVGVQLNGGRTFYFTIEVADVNDNPPILDGNHGSQISLDVPENQLNDSLLILTATDADVGATATLTYSLDTEGYDDTFKLNALTKDGKPACQLQMLKELDYETRPLYKLTITVTDMADDRGEVRSSSVTVFVNVEDVGDTAPRWLLPPTASDVDENTPLGTQLLTVEAIDGDTAVNNRISYSVISQDPDGLVEMLDDKTGVVTLKSALDREDPDLADGYITVVVEARESPASDPDQPCSEVTCLSGTAFVIVHDLDDNSPAFEQSSYSASFPENTTGAVDLLITVSDADTTPPNSVMQLSLAGAPVGVFGLSYDHGPSPLTTYILVKDGSYMDYEKPDHRETVFQIVAIGDSQPRRTAYATVTISLINIDG